MDTLGEQQVQNGDACSCILGMRVPSGQPCHAPQAAMLSQLRQAAALPVSCPTPAGNCRRQCESPAALCPPDIQPIFPVNASFPPQPCLPAGAARADLQSMRPCQQPGGGVHAPVPGAARGAGWRLACAPPACAMLVHSAALAFKVQNVPNSPADLLLPCGAWTFLGRCAALIMVPTPRLAAAYCLDRIRTLLVEHAFGGARVVAACSLVALGRILCVSHPAARQRGRLLGG